MSFFSGLDIEKYDRQYSDRQLARRIVTHFKPFKSRLVKISAFVIIYSIAGAIIPLVVSRSIDSLAGTSKAATVYLLGAGVTSMGVLIWVSNYFRRRLTARTIGDVVLNLQVDAFTSVTSHDLSFHDEFSSGRIVSRITSDTRDLGQIVVIITDLVAQVIEALILGTALLFIQWKLTALLFLFMPVLYVLANVFRTLARKVTRRGMRAMANVNATIKETISGIAIAKNFRQEATIFNEFDSSNTQSYQVNLIRGFVLALVFPVLNVLNGIATALLVYAGGMSASAGLVTAGSWYLFILSLDRFWFPVMNLTAFWSQLQSGLSAAERIFALIDAESTVRQIDPIPVDSVTGYIEFKDVHFQYKKDERVLENFNLTIGAGENVAFVGHTGAGKTSIAKLIARFYEFQSGNITIDHRDIRSFDLVSYRKHLGIVSQIPFLFSGSVYDNICYATTEVNYQDVKTLTEKIGNGEWIDSLPNGLETEVGERGVLLSMGQRQLVSLMRVLIQRPAIFILDEATASIDPFTEWQIQQTLNLILKNTTSIMIAHRLSTVKAADRIIVLEKGKIIEEGNHEGLMKNGGNYATLYNTYFRHQSLAYIDQIRKYALSD